MWLLVKLLVIFLVIFLIDTSLPIKIVLAVVFLVISIDEGILLPIIKPFRSMRMRRLADKYNFNYEKSDSRIQGYPRKQNIIKGSYHGKDWVIYDYDTYIGIIASGKSKNVILDKIAVEEASKKHKKFLTHVNGKYFKDFGTAYLSIKKIEKYINGKVVPKEFIKKSFNITIFIIIELTALFTGFVLYTILELFLSETLSIIFAIILNLAVLPINYNWCKKNVPNNYLKIF